MKDWLLLESLRLLKRGQLALTTGGQERLQEETDRFVEILEQYADIIDKPNNTFILMQPRTTGKTVAAHRQIEVLERQIQKLRAYVDSTQEQHEAFIQARAKAAQEKFMSDILNMSPIFTIDSLSEISNLLSDKHMVERKHYLTRKPKPYFRQFGKANRY